MMIGPDPKMRIVFRSSRRGTWVRQSGHAAARRGCCYSSPLLPDSFRMAVVSTREKPPHTKAITKIMLIHVAPVMGCSPTLKAARRFVLWRNRSTVATDGEL